MFMVLKHAERRRSPGVPGRRQEKAEGQHEANIGGVGGNRAELLKKEKKTPMFKPNLLTK